MYATELLSIQKRTIYQAAGRLAREKKAIAETVRDLTQETLAALSGAIDRYDPARGARLKAVARLVSGPSVAIVTAPAGCSLMLVIRKSTAGMS